MKLLLKFNKSLFLYLFYFYFAWILCGLLVKLSTRSLLGTNSNIKRISRNKMGLIFSASNQIHEAKKTS